VTDIAVIQARMGSTRLPGKVLADLGGRPLLDLMLARLRPAPVDAVVVATSTSTHDDPVVRACRAVDVPVVRGPEADLLARFTVALQAFPADNVVRLTADCPLADPDVVGQALTRHHETGADYTSNTLIRTFPDGLDTEVVRAAALQQAAEEARDPDEREHVTPFIYRRPERYRLVSFASGEALGAERWTVDTPADLERLQAIVARLDDPVAADWRTIVTVAGRSAVSDSPDLRVEPELDGEPAARRWRVLRRGALIGHVGLHVRSGRGSLRTDIGPADRQQAVDLVRRALADDYQVVEFEDGASAVDKLS